MIYSIVMFISMMGAYLIITTKELTVLRQFIALEVRAKINLQIIAEVGKLNHCVVIYRNAILSALFFCKYFLLTMSINLLCAFCLWTLTKSSRYSEKCALISSAFPKIAGSMAANP